MGRDAEVPEHFGMLHGSKNTPHRSIWTLAFISAVLGIVVCLFWFCDASAASDTSIQALPTTVWYSFGLWHNTWAANFPSGFLVAGLISNFGTFLLYMMTCIVAIVAFREHHMFNGIKHMAIPLFGLLANLGCMLFYLVGPWFVNGLSTKEPYCALGFAALWGIYGMGYFIMNSGHRNKPIFNEAPTPTSTTA